jgi:hypothetical protein
MMTHVIAVSLLVVLAVPARAQDHLIPDTDAFADPDSHLLKCRHVFAAAFEPEVTVRALVIPSFSKEYVVGIHVGDASAEAFVLEPSSSIWDTELLEMYTKGEIGPALTSEGKEIPLDRDQAYIALKKRTPEDYRAIKAVRRARPLPKGVADGIGTLWKAMLLGVRHSEKEDGLDGITYRFSTWIRGRGNLSGHVWEPEPESKTGQLARLAEALAEFARGGAPLKTLEVRLEAARKSIVPAAR